MSVFLVLTSDDGEHLTDIITSKISEVDRFNVDEKTWLVSSPDNVVTPKELSDYFDLSDGKVGTVLITLVTSYYGYHSRQMWDWLNVKRA